MAPPIEPRYTNNSIKLKCTCLYAFAEYAEVELLKGSYEEQGQCRAARSTQLLLLLLLLL